MISNEQLKQFYTNNRNLIPLYKIDQLINLKKDDGKYMDLKSNKQIQTIYNSSGYDSGTNDYQYVRGKLMSLFLKHVLNDRQLILSKLGNNDGDLDVYNTLHSIIQKESGNKAYPPSHLHNIGHRQKKVENFRFTILKHLNGKKAGKYLDFACGDCKVTPYMGKGIGAGKDCVYGADIANWGNYNENTRNVRGMTFVEIPTTGRYPFNDNMFGVISCMMALHHVVDLHGTLGELSRIIKKGGLLYITEHNVTNYVEKMLIDVEHAIYEIGHRQTFGFADTYIGNFKHWTEWTYLLHQHGFEYIEHGELSYDVTDQDDPTKRVWILYKKLS